MSIKSGLQNSDLSRRSFMKPHPLIRGGLDSFQGTLDWADLPGRIREMVKFFCSLPLSARVLHSNLQTELLHMAEDYGCEGIGEYPVQYELTAKRNGLIDAVWLHNGKREAAFEVDSSFRLKSVKKLLALEVPRRFWIVYRPRREKAYLQEHDPFSTITLIKINDTVSKPDDIDRASLTVVQCGGGE